MTKIISISSEDDVKYLTFERDAGFEKSFQSFLSDIGIARDKRKNLYKGVYIRAGRSGGDHVGTLQTVHNKDRTINMEVFTMDSTVVVVVHYTGDGEKIGDALGKNFDFLCS